MLTSNKMTRKTSPETTLKNKNRSADWDKANRDAKNRRNRDYRNRKREEIQSLKTRLDNLEKYIECDFVLDI